MVLNLRLIERAEYAVRSAFGSCEAFERYLNENVCWVFEQTERRYLNAKWVEYPPSTILLAGNCKAVLARPRPSKDNFYNEIQYVILTVLTVSKDDRAEALKARELDEPIKIFDHGLLPARLVQGNAPNNLHHPPRDITTPTPEPAPSAPAPPEVVRAAPRERTQQLSQVTTPEPKTQRTEKATTATPREEDQDKQRFIITPKCPRCNTNLAPGRGLYCQQCSLKLPPELAVHPELVVVIIRKEYDKLATHLKQATNVAWNQLLKGRKVTRTLNSMGQNLFIITVQDETRTSTLTDEQQLDNILIDTGIGRLTTDAYELREAHRMTDQKPQPA
jgi:hypothetical protein